MTPFSVSADFAKGLVEKSGFNKGGVRFCRKCKRHEQVTPEKIALWFQGTGTPPCKICGKKTELLTVEEFERSQQ